MLKLALFRLAPCKSKIDCFPWIVHDEHPMLKYLRQSMARNVKTIRNTSRGVKNHFKAFFFLLLLNALIIFYLNLGNKRW